jgi:hypothetical protein
MTSSALERIDPVQALTQEPWINQINSKQLELVQKTVAKGLNNAETGQFLELARSLGMNPWAREIWAAKGQAKDGREGQLLIMVGRDGLIGHAERNFADYAGYDSGVVYENDEFQRVAPDAEGKSLRERAGVVHTQAHPKDRGGVVGAWAAAERTGRPPRYFYAALDEYMPRSDKKREFTPWGSAVAVMIEKVPISIVHRTLCGLGAVYLEEEVARAFDAEATVVEENPEALSEAVLEHVADKYMKRAMKLINEMNEVAPNFWTPAKVEMVFGDKDARDTEKELKAIETAIGEIRDRMAAPEEPGVGERVDAENRIMELKQQIEADVLDVDGKNAALEEIERLEQESQAQGALDV